MDHMSAFNTSWIFPPPQLHSSITTIPPTTFMSDFESRFQNFIHSRPQSAPKQRRPPIISGTKTILIHVQDLIQSVQHQSSLLQQQIESMSDADFTMASSNIVAQQQIISELLDTVAEPKQLELINKAINKRRRKRKRIRSSRSKPSKPHPIVGPQLVASTSSNTKTTSDTVELVSNVSNIKSSRASAFLTLFEQLKELHRIRSQQAGKEAATPPMLEHLYSMWTDAAAHYRREEHSKETDNDSQSSEQMWQRVLFGHIKRDTLQIDAEPDLQRLIGLRQSWDEFLVEKDNPFGSSIPLGFILPSNESTPWTEKQASNMDVDQPVQEIDM